MATYAENKSTITSNKLHDSSSCYLLLSSNAAALGLVSMLFTIFILFYDDDNVESFLVFIPYTIMRNL